MSMLDVGRSMLTLDVGRWTVGRWDVGTLGRWDVGTLGRWDVGTLGRWDVGTLGRWDVDLKPSDHTMGYFSNHVRSEKKCCGACMPRIQNVEPASAAYSGPLPEPRWFVKCSLIQRVICQRDDTCRPAHLSSQQKRCVFGTGSLNM